MTATEQQDEYADIRDAVAKLCAQFPGEYWRKLDREMAYPTEFVDALTEAGYLSVLIPEEYGGAGLKLSAAAAILEEIQRAGCNGGGCHAQMYTMGTLLRHGSDEQKAKWLPKIASGELRLQAFGVTEPTSGTDTSSLKTFAKREGNDGYIVNGQKIWTSRAEHSDLMILLARTTPKEQAKKRTDGLSVFIVDMREAKGNGLDDPPDPHHDEPRHHGSVLHRHAGAGRKPDRRGRQGLSLHPLRHERRAHPDRGRMHRRRQMVHREGDRLRQGAHRVRPADRPEPGHPVSDRQSLCRDARGRTDGEGSHPQIRSRARLRRRGQHGEDAGGRCVLGGGERLRADPWRLWLRRGIRRRAQIPRDAALSGGADLDQSDPVTTSPSTCSACPAPTEKPACCRSKD